MGGQSTQFNYQGRTWQESFPQPIKNTCTKNPKSPILNNPPTGIGYPTVNSAVTEAMPIDGISSGYDDAIGLNTAAVQELRMLGDTPCQFTVTQYVALDNDKGTFTTYQIDTDTTQVGDGFMNTNRNGVAITFPYLTPLQKSQGFVTTMLMTKK